LNEEINRPFDLSKDWLARVMLIRLKAESHILVVTMHHIISDEWSLKVFFRELAEFYGAFVENVSVSLPELPVQYADFVTWEQNCVQRTHRAEHLSFWREHLCDAPPPLELPADSSRRAGFSIRGSRESLRLGEDLRVALDILAKQTRTTPFMVLLAAFKALLYRYTGQEDLCVATPFAGRNQIETEGLIGFFVNTLPLRTRAGGDLTFKEWLIRVRKVVLDACAHQDLPLEKLVQELEPERASGHMPYTNIMFALQDELLAGFRLPGISHELIEVSTSTSKFDLTLFVQQTGDGLVIRAEYSQELFDRRTVIRLLEHFKVLLCGIAADASQRLSQLPLLGAGERQLIIEGWNKTSSDYPRDFTIHEIFERQAALQPGAAAVKFGEESLTYAELNARADAFATKLREGAGVVPGTRVAVCLNPSVDLVVSLLAILKAGAAYVPLDPACPKEWLAFMLSDADVSVLLTESSLAQLLPQTEVQTLCIDPSGNANGIARRTSKRTDASHSVPLTGSSPLAYIIYTSGSTGRPKGVAVPHRAVNRLVLNSNYLQIESTDRIAQVSNLSFDAATLEIWGALMNGALLVGIDKSILLAPTAFADELRRQSITVMFLTSALFNQLATETPSAFASLRALIVGGDALDPKHIRAVLENHSPRCLINGYGPTENTTFTCCHLIERVPEGATTVPIGRPISNTQVFILDAQLNPVPVGVRGELFTGGDGLAVGYWNRPDLTAEKFIPNPFGGGRLYRTGDLARYRPDGTVEFLGRIDQQVKIRGFRVELEEIEANLEQHSDVRDAAVVVQEPCPGEKRLVAFIIQKLGKPVRVDALRRFLEGKLPPYMVPAAFVELEKLPLTPHGKLDREVLKSLKPPEDTGNHVAPRNSTETALAKIWQEVLGRNGFGVTENFFHLGGHSLLAVRLVANVERELGRRVSLASFLQGPTIAQMATSVRSEFPIDCEGHSKESSLVELQGQGSRPPLVLVHGAGGGMLWGYANLAHHLGADRPVYALTSQALAGKPEFETIEAMAASYVEVLRRTQPHGPYYLGGYCFGGDVAYEMARQLHASGAQIAFLGLLNSVPPNSSYARIPFNPVWGIRFLRNLVYWGNYVRQLKPEARRELFHWKLGILKKRLSSGVRGSNRLDIGDFVNLSALSPTERRLWETHIQALFDYQPEPFAGRVHLFRSPGHQVWCSMEPHYGWRGLAQGGVDVTIVPGAHERILEEPFVQTLAAELRKALDKRDPPPVAFARRAHFQPEDSDVLPSPQAVVS
jgi:amino acid adenylation domain-containing protein